MKAADINVTTRPSFSLMKQNHILSFYHLQIPRWLFSHNQYKGLSLEAKVAYSFLLNRFQLSRLNGWLNSEDEVFIIFTRENLAEEMQITYKKAIACFKELTACNLIWERRLGRGHANQIYLAVVELSTKAAKEHNIAPFGNEGTRPADIAVLEIDKDVAQEEITNNTANQDMPKEHICISQNGSPRPAEMEVLDMPKEHTSYIDKNYIDKSYIEVSQSVTKSKQELFDNDRQTNDKQEEGALDKILEHSELWVLPKEAESVFHNAIERLFYSSQLRVGDAILPQKVIHSQLWKIDGMVLQEAYSKLIANTNKVKNSTAYVMVTLINAIHELQSDILLDPYLNSLGINSHRGGI